MRSARAIMSACLGNLALLLAGSCAVDWDEQVAEGVERQHTEGDGAIDAAIPEEEAADTSEAYEGDPDAEPAVELADADAGAPLLLPADVHLWFSADRGLTVDTNGRVLAWDDQSGQGLSALAESEALAPGVDSDADLPLVTFDGTQELRLAEVAPVGVLTFFAVAEAAVEDRKCPSILHLSNTQDGFMQMADLEFGRHQRELYYEAGSKGVPQGVMHTDSFSVHALHVVSVRHEPSTLAVTRLDGRDVHSRLMELPPEVIRSHNFIGHNHYYANAELSCERFLGRVAEIILYARLLDASERAQVERYLSEKWHVPLQAAPSDAGEPEPPDGG